MCSNIPTSRILLFLFSVLLFLIGAAYLGIGGYFLNVLQNSPNFYPIQYYYRVMGALMVSAGIMAVLLSVFGVILSFARSVALLSLYIFFLVFLMIFGIATGIVGLILSHVSFRWITNSLTPSNFFTLVTLGDIDLADSIQSSYKCCGLDSPADWSLIASDPDLPLSCCIGTKEFNCQGGTFYQNGCLAAVRNSIKTNMAISGGISLGIALPIIIGIILTGGLILELTNRFNKYKNKKPTTF